MNIILVGFMGTGKTAVGKMLAKRLKMEFIDLDDRIEETEGRTILEIFKRRESHISGALRRRLSKICLV